MWNKCQLMKHFYFYVYLFGKWLFFDFVLWIDIYSRKWGNCINQGVMKKRIQLKWIFSTLVYKEPYKRYNLLKIKMCCLVAIQSNFFTISCYWEVNKTTGPEVSVISWTFPFEIHFVFCVYIIYICTIRTWFFTS